MNTILAVVLDVNTLSAAAGMILATLTIAGIIGLFVANFKNSKQGQLDKNANDASISAQTTISILKEQIAAQKQDMLNRDTKHELEITEMRNKYVESGKAIANLQGQIDIIKNIPLVEIDKSLKRISSILESSAITLASDTKLNKI